MTRYSFAVITFVCISIISVSILFAEDNAVKGGTIRGEILDTELIPIEGVEVKIVSSDGKIFTTKTDANGNYKYSGIPGRRYTVNFRKEGYGTRTGKSVVVVNGGTHIAQRKMVNTKGIHKNKIEPLVHHITENIGMLYHLDRTTVNELRQSINDSIETSLKHDKSMVSIVLDTRLTTSTGTGILEALLSHPDTKSAFAKHLNAQQLQDYINYTKARRQRIQQAYAHLITALLNQSLSLTTEQRIQLTQLLLNKLNTIEDLKIQKNITQPFQEIVDFIINELKLSLDSILNQTQSKILRVMLNIHEDSKPFKDVIGVEVLEAPGEAAAKPDKQQKQLQINTKEEIQESQLWQLAEAVLAAHTEQLGLRNKPVSQRLDLAAKGVVQQFTETQNDYADSMVPFIANIGSFSLKALTDKITREEAVQELKAILKDLQDNKNTNNLQWKYDIAVITYIPIYQQTLNSLIFDRISGIINHPLYQQTIKDVLSVDAYEQYIKKQKEAETFLQQTAHDVIVAIFDLHLLMNNTQREQLMVTTEQLALPFISVDGLLFIILELYLRTGPETWSSWQQSQFEIRGE